MDVFAHEMEDVFPRVEELAGANEFRAPVTRLLDTAFNHVLEHLFSHFGFLESGERGPFEMRGLAHIVDFSGHFGVYMQTEYYYRSVKTCFLHHFTFQTPTLKSASFNVIWQLLLFNRLIAFYQPRNRQRRFQVI
jgi:hypothetical protein